MHKRTYNSELREKSKQQTIERIVETTYIMHSEGITDIKAIADNSGVSIPTIRKYFPTNEDLFRGCANHFLKVNKIPEVYRYLNLTNIEEKVASIVHDFYTFYEDTLEIVWLSFRLADQSKVMKNATLQNEAIVKAVAQVMLQDLKVEVSKKAQLQGYIQSLLHPLFYRTLRTVSSIEKEDCIKQTEKAILALLKEEK